MLALNSIPNAISDTEIGSTLDWFNDSIYKPVVSPKHGKGYVSDQGGLGCKIEKKYFDKFALQKLEFELKH
jgi:hypothetical protein